MKIRSILQLSTQAKSPDAKAACALTLYPPQSKTWRRFIATLALAALPVVSVSAQSYTIGWSKIAGGGGTSAAGAYQVSGTIGQHDAGGPMTGGNYSLTGGFWALYAVQTPGAPTLYISRSGNTVTVYWQNVSGWSLQQNGSLTNTGGWSPSSSPTFSNGTNYLSITPSTGNLFFRLASQ
jgi:hypothetical protein